MLDDRPMWMKLATLREDACISAHYSLEVVRFMRDWLEQLASASAAEGYLAMAEEAIQILDEEQELAESAIESGDWMPDPL
jgi:DNA-binding GntR family transcriptional regulator